jgi:tetratricopeptide (TPR) repeat protein
MRLNPNYPAPYAMNLGWAYQHTGQQGKALTAYKKAVNLNPDIQGARLHLISLYMELGQKEEARAEAAEVLLITPNFSAEEFGQRNAYADRAELERFVEELRQIGLK